MTTTLAALFESKLAETVDTKQYTSDNCKTTIDKITATNVTSAIALITVYLVAPGGSAGAANTITINKGVAPGYPYTFPEIVGHTLDIGGSIWTKAGTASALVIRASGRQIN